MFSYKFLLKQLDYSLSISMTRTCSTFGLHLHQPSSSTSNFELTMKLLMSMQIGIYSDVKSLLHPDDEISSHFSFKVFGWSGVRAWIDCVGPVVRPEKLYNFNSLSSGDKFHIFHSIASDINISTSIYPPLKRLKSLKSS
jgi:hypothetical protein